MAEFLQRYSARGQKFDRGKREPRGAGDSENEKKRKKEEREARLLVINNDDT
jgi:hypothetical protein